MKNSIAVIVPAFNEAGTLGDLVAEIKKKASVNEVLVIDDGSEDRTKLLPQTAGIRFFSHPYNIGNGAAIKSGIRAAESDILVFMDADGQHDPGDIPKLLEHIDQYDMVIGARSNDQQASWIRAWANRIYNRMASYVTGFPIKDLTSGFRVLRAEAAYDLLPLLPNGYSWPTTSTLVLLRSGLSVKYLPINLRQRQGGCSRIRPLRDGIRFFLIILKICTLYSPFRIFLPVSALMVLLGFANYAYTYITAGRFTNMSALMFVSSVIIFMMGLISEQISQVSLMKHLVRSRVTQQQALHSKSPSDQPD